MQPKHKSSLTASLVLLQSLLLVQFPLKTSNIESPSINGAE